MKTIEINTSFNVVIKFNLANVFERGLAFIIDLLIMWALVGFLSLIFYNIINNPSDYLFLYFAAPIMGFYTIISEIILNGQTIGKKALKIQVVRIDGKRTGPADFFMRWIFRIIDIYFSASVLAILTITSSQKAQRLGDILADTCVIKIKERPETSLNSIVKLDKLNEIEPVYPEIIKLTETEMMLIKESVERYNKYPNEAHLNAINLLIKNLENLLQIKCNIDKVEFLKTLIRDYVILTR